ncbi:hypothetical protein P7C71_g5350, partial [Lecanoromycetidae sp. Uapishka_2]
MPGQKLVVWTQENEIKLLHAIIAVHDLKLDYAKVAAIFDPNIPASSIATHMSKLRKKVASAVNSQAPISTTSSTRTKAPAKAKQIGKKGKTQGRKPGGILCDVPSNDDETMADAEKDSEEEAAHTESDDDDAAAPTTSSNKRQKTIGGRITKTSAAPRKTLKQIKDSATGLDNSTNGEEEPVLNSPNSEIEDSGAGLSELGEESLPTIIKHEESVTEEAV